MRILALFIALALAACTGNPKIKGDGSDCHLLDNGDLCCTAGCAEDSR